MLRLYHGTDAACADAICSGGFIYKPNNNHWLGNGVYFYTDLDLAKWWTTNPSSQFGTRVKNPAVIVFDIDISPDSILDLRTLSGYRKCISLYSKYESIAFKNIEFEEISKKKQIRCSFFDFAFEYSKLSCVIGNFYLGNNAYLSCVPQNILDELRRFNLPFIETQVCIKNGLDNGTIVDIIKE